MKVSIIIPVYNEIAVIGNCIASLERQTVKSEIIIVDDGSTDGSEKYATLKQKHQGPGAARNLGVSKCKGETLVFVDADMEFEPDFIEKLVAPIVSGKAIGTYSTEELLLNPADPWAVCWNLNFSGQKNRVAVIKKESFFQRSYHLVKRFLETAETKIAPVSHQNVSSLVKGSSSLPYRAILKSEFLGVGGFSTNVGYTDDWTLAEKLNQLPTPVVAKYYHRNPATLSEIWKQARWIGKDELKTGNIVRQIHSLIIYNPISGAIIGVLGSYKFRMPRFFIFKIVFNTAVFLSVIQSFFDENKTR